MTDDEFEIFFRDSVDLLAIADLDGYFKKLNDSWEETLGWTMVELCSRPWLDFVHPEDKASTLAQAGNLANGQPILEFSNRYLCRDGSYKWISWRVTAPPPGSTRLYANARDMTRQKADSDLILMIVEASPSAMVLTDNKGHIRLVNKKTESLFGYEREALLGNPIEMLIPDDLRDRHTELRKRYSRKPDVRPLGSLGTLKGRHRDGELIPLEIGLNPITTRDENFVLAAIVDITERERRLELEKVRAGLEASIIERERHAMRLVVRSAVTTALSQADTFEDVAPGILQAICESLDWALGEVWTRDARDESLKFLCGWYLPGESALSEFEDAARDNGSAQEEGLVAQVWETGKAKWLTDVADATDCPRRELAAKKDLHGVFAFPVISENKVTAVMMFFSHTREQPDSSLLNMMADFGNQIGQFIVRQNLRLQLEQSQKVESIGRLAGGIAHDFNNLLTVINGYSESVIRKLDLNDPIREDLQEILDAGQKAGSLTKQLLAFSRKQVLQPKVVNINSIVQDMERLLNRLIGEDISLSSNLATDLESIKVDPSQREQVIMNLSVNARDAMPNGGNLYLETANVYLDNTYIRTHDSVVSGPYVMLAISDNGVGMDRETQQHIFEPFFTTKEMGKGTGLGLATVHGIVKQSGGHIWVYSEAGKGTTFKVYFPIEKGEADTPESQGLQATPGGVETLLLVEDEKAVRRLTAGLLKDAGYQVLEAASGPEALEIFMKHQKSINLLVSDVVMPGMSGPELHRRLSEIRPGLPSLFMSGYTNVAIVNYGVVGSDVHFLQKPFTHMALTTKVREVLDLAGNIPSTSQ